MNRRTLCEAATIASLLILLVVLAALSLVMAGNSAESIRKQAEAAKREQTAFASLTGKTVSRIGRDPRDDDTVLMSFDDGSTLRLHAHGYKGANLDATFSEAKQ